MWHHYRNKREMLTFYDFTLRLWFFDSPSVIWFSRMEIASGVDICYVVAFSGPKTKITPSLLKTDGHCRHLIIMYWKGENISCSLNIKNTNVASNYVCHNSNKCLFICFSSVSPLKTFGKHCLIYKFLFLLKACWFLFILRYLRLLQAEGHSPLFELSLNSTLQLEVNQFY